MWIGTGSDLMDCVVGGGRGYGYEAGQVINMCAPSGAGKSMLVSEIIASAYHKYGNKCKWVYDDCESGYTFDSKALYGIDIIGDIRSTTIEDCFGNIMGFLDSLKEDEFGIYAIDSIDGLVSDEIDDIVDERLKAHKAGKEFDKGSYQGGKPKFLSSIFLPKVADMASKKNCLVIIVSQLRDNIGAGMYAPKDRVSNGRALLFYSHARIWLTTKHTEEKNDRAIGATLLVTTKKLKGPRPYREAMVSYYFRYGIDNIGTNLDYLYGLRTPERGELKKKALCEWDGEEYLREDMIKFIEENGLEAELSRKVIETWEAQEAEAEAGVAGRKRRF